MLTHFSKDGRCKLKSQCELPLTGQNVVDTIVTNLGMFEPAGGKFRITKLAPGVCRDDLGIEDDLLTEA